MADYWTAGQPNVERKMGNILDMTISEGWTSGQQNGRLYSNYCHFAGKMAEHKTRERQTIEQEDIRKKCNRQREAYCKLSYSIH
jgi:hypothetical protein